MAAESASALPGLSSDLDPPAACIEEFRSKGHTVVRELATAEEVAAYRPAILEAAPGSRYDHRPLEERDTYGKAFVQMLNVWPRDERVRAFVFARRFARVAALLLGVPAVRLYHDQALFKEPGGGFTPWHQDQFYWPLETTSTITLWMPLVDVSEPMGPMVFASGSQRLGNLGDHAIGDTSQAVFADVIREKQLPVEGHAPFAAGDASFHAGWTLHSAPPNRSARMREVMTIIYFPNGTRIGPADHPARDFDRKIWLDGLEPGEIAAGPLNPLLYDSGRHS